MDENVNMALRVELIIKRKYENLQLGGDGLFQLTQQKHTYLDKTWISNYF